MKCWSFFKVGGGFRAEDYSEIKYRTSGKWIDWDSKHPPNEFIELAGGDRQNERPDVWIKPCDSVVLEVKAASVGGTETFRTGFTLRFPRFKKIRADKDWQSALSLSEFAALKTQVEKESKEKGELVVDTKRRMTKRLKKEIVIAGNETAKTPYAGPKTELFHGLNFCVMSDMINPYKKSLADITQLIKANGGAIFQTHTVRPDMLCIGDKNAVSVASIKKTGLKSVIRPIWVFDAVKQFEADGPDRQRYLLPFEPKHIFCLPEDSPENFENNVDVYHDSYTRDTDPDELTQILDDMIHPKTSDFSPTTFLSQLEDHNHGLGELPGSLFARCVVRFVSGDGGHDNDFLITKNRFLFAGGREAVHDEDEEITHFVVVGDVGAERLRGVREGIADREGRIPRVVGGEWVEESWGEKTLLDEERYAVGG